jgi:hypothetical protein
MLNASSSEQVAARLRGIEVLVLCHSRASGNPESLRGPVSRIAAREFSAAFLRPAALGRPLLRGHHNAGSRKRRGCQRKSLKRQRKVRIVNLDFVPPNLEFVPLDLDFVPKNLDIVPVRLDLLHRAGARLLSGPGSWRASGRASPRRLEQGRRLAWRPHLHPAMGYGRRSASLGMRVRGRLAYSSSQASQGPLRGPAAALASIAFDISARGPGWCLC